MVVEVWFAALNRKHVDASNPAPYLNRHAGSILTKLFNVTFRTVGLIITITQAL